MKKILIYVVILAIGLLLGWFLFGGSSNNETNPNHDTIQETNKMWTCSMHPQIMQQEAGNCPICGMDLIPATSTSEGLRVDQFKLTENAMALANIQTSVVGNGKIEDNTIKLSGKIVENEEANAVQVSYFSGRLEQLVMNGLDWLGTSFMLLQAPCRTRTPKPVPLMKALFAVVTLTVLLSQPAPCRAAKKKKRKKPRNAGSHRCLLLH